MTQDLEKPVVAVDIGSTKMNVALFSPDGKLLSSTTIPTLVEEGADSVITRLGDCIEAVITGAGKTPAATAGIGIACAGGIDTERGMVVTPSPNLPDWVDVPLAARMRERFGVPAYIINDASAAALGEHRYGAGRGVNNLVLLTLGTGIGGGIITNGKLYLGACGAAAEIGHMAIAEGPPCGCGNSGCFEMLASGTAIERDAATRLEHGEQSVLRETIGDDYQAVTAEQVAEAAGKDDLLAREVLASAAHYLGVGMVNWSISSTRR